MRETPLEIIFRDDTVVVINKPHGLLVHKSPIAADTDEFAVQILRDQIGQRVSPVHRLDRKTGGLLVFALTDAANQQLQGQFMNGTVSKIYHAIVRGFTPDEGEIDYPLKRDDGVVQQAFTRYRTLSRTELDLPLGKHATSRYSWVALSPETGRMHQLRKHMAHIFHPIIGDRPHGCNKQNKLFKEHFAMDTMLLHARQLELRHPVSGMPLSLEADYQTEFKRMLTALQFETTAR